MLDVKLMRENLDEVKTRMATRGAEIDWNDFVALDRERREALANIERLKEKRNRLSGESGNVNKNGGDATALIRDVGDVSEDIRAAEGPLAEIEARFEQFMLTLPNLPNLGVPVGKNSDDNSEIRRWGDLPKFAFEPKNHWD